MECPNCGQENRDIARFCQTCGASLVTAEHNGEIRLSADEPGSAPRAETADQALLGEQPAPFLAESGPAEAAPALAPVPEDAGDAGEVPEPTPVSTEPQWTPIGGEGETVVPTTGGLELDTIEAAAAEDISEWSPELAPADTAGTEPPSSVEEMSELGQTGETSEPARISSADNA